MNPAGTGARTDRLRWWPSPRHAIRRQIASSPGLYLTSARLRADRWPIDARTQLVIDGFTRSASTFAVIAFQMAQNDHVRVAHHTHAAASLVMAARREVPALVAVRQPEDTVVSSAIRESGPTLRQWLKTYVAFYERIAPFRGRLVVASFDEITTDFGSVIEHVNARFGTRFRRFEHTEDHVRDVFALIDERAEGPPWQPHLNRFASGLLSFDEYNARTQHDREASGGRRGVPEFRVPRPTAAKQAMKDNVRDRYRDPSLRRWRDRAEAAYRRLVP